MNNLLKTTFAALFISLTGVSNAQLCLGNDTTVCAGSSLSIIDCNPGSGGSGSQYQLTSPTYVSLSDDQWSGAVPIGFTFNFYGANYTQCVIGSNGLVSFNLSNANGSCPWSLTGVGPLPNTFNPAWNSAMPAYHDINPNTGGTIYYQTMGTSPNRKFIVVWDNIPAYGAPGNCTNMALVLFETSNNIEAHIGFKPITASWNGGLAIQGLENNGGSVAHITPGRNNTQWTATNDARIWVPTSPSNTTAYTISSTTYGFYDAGGAPQWGNTLGQTFPYNSGTLNIPSVQSGTVGYFLTTVTGAACANNPISAVSDTSWVTGYTPTLTASGTDDICSAGMGTVTANPTSGQTPYTFNWPGLGGATTQTVTGVYAGTYTVQMTDAVGCTGSAQVTIGDVPANYQSSSTLVTCPGGNDGTATAEMVPAIGNLTYQWDDPMAQTTQTATGLAAGTYNCTITSDVGCQNTVAVTVSEIPGMIGTITSQTDVTCNSGDDGMIEISVTQGTAPYSYSWDNSTSTTNIADDLEAGTHTCTITDSNGCVITVTGTIGEPAPLDITFITPDTQICPEDSIYLNVSGTGGSSAYTFTWFENGQNIGTGTTIGVDPNVTNTQYCVTLSEACGSPTDNECSLIYFPTPIVPNAVPDETEKCIDFATFDFDNTSSNPGEIATTYWDFGDDQLIALTNGAAPTSMTFPEVGTYDLTMTITSIYGCVYTQTIPNIIEVKPRPTADFFFSTNPATIFETAVTMQDKSTSDVIEWTWLSPYSNPSGSNEQNPSFQFPEGEVGNYPVTLIVETERGCTDTVTYYFNVIEDILFFAPNTFTPDGDEYNQVWKPEITGIDIYHFDLYIFNRWGEMVWESHDPSVGWDGTYHGEIAQSGTYVWKATVKDPIKDRRVDFNGFITLIK